MPRNIKCKNCNNLKNAGWCEKVIDSPDPERLRDCQYFWEKTNGDCIRAKTDEELAEYIVSLTASEFIGNVKAQSELIGGTRITEIQIAEAIESLRQSWLEWLRKPAGEETR